MANSLLITVLRHRCTLQIVIFSVVLYQNLGPMYSQYYNVMVNETNIWLTIDFYTLKNGAGIGNQMYELASLYGIASTLHMKPFIQIELQEQMLALTKLFPLLKAITIKNISTSIITFGSKCCTYENVNLIRNFSSHNLTLNGVYFQAHRYFHHIRVQIKELFSFSSFAMEMANMIKRQALTEIYSRMECKPKLPFALACVHIRRGDFVNAPDHLESQETFTVEVDIGYISVHYVTITNFKPRFHSTEEWT